jgi:hypothetical protein
MAKLAEVRFNSTKALAAARSAAAKSGRPSPSTSTATTENGWPPVAPAPRLHEVIGGPRVHNKCTRPW